MPRRAAHSAAILISGLLGLAGVAWIVGRGGALGWLLAGFLLLAARFALRPRAGELALLARCVAALAALAALVVGGVFAAWESAEVVVLRYTDDRGEPIESRLWVIDLDGDPWVPTGAGHRRIAMLRANPDVELVRGGRAECRRAVVLLASEAADEQRRTARRLFEEKYGLRPWATRVLAFLLGGAAQEEPALIRLAPCAWRPGASPDMRFGGGLLLFAARAVSRQRSGGPVLLVAGFEGALYAIALAGLVLSIRAAASKQAS